jgi:hypothetical protein
MTAFRCDDTGIYGGTYGSDYRLAQTGSPLSKVRQKMFASGSARMGNPQRSVALSQANWTASMQYQ